MFGFATSPRLVRLLQAAGCLFILICLSIAYYPSRGKPALNFPHHVEVSERPRHPIDDLRERARKELTALIERQSYTLEAAERAYLARRARRPPPGFDKWFRYAQDNNAIIVEEYFDRIYDDLDPFWGMSAADIRHVANQWFFRVSVRSGNVTKRMDHDRPWLFLWSSMVEQVAEHLPDMDIAINEMDESRIIAPWEVVNDHMQKAASTKHVTPLDKLKTTFANTAMPDDAEPPQIDWRMTGEGLFWDMAVKGCHPESPAKKDYTVVRDFTELPHVDTAWPKGSYKGYVQNWTYVKSACEHPDMQALHGSFVEPLSVSTSDKLLPMFGGSKLSMNNEILLPAAMYWTDDPFYSGGDSHGGPWKDKIDMAIWRGAASGGRNKAENWARFQRHRFVAMMNSTTIARTESGELVPPNFAVAHEEPYGLTAAKDGKLASWLSKISDAAFVHLLCFPDPNPPFCEYVDPWYLVAPAMPMSKQYNYKYLPDIDGNSFSGRYRGFLGSTSLPIKATIYDEWHDSRLMPWVHFVPMDNTFVDIYGILEYLIGTKESPGHDDVAQKMAADGKQWAEKVLRKEDMAIYVLRLLLEYARLCDDDRDNLGWASGL